MRANYRVEIDFGTDWRWHADDCFFTSLRSAKTRALKRRADGEKRTVRVVRIKETVVFQRPLKAGGAS